MERASWVLNVQSIVLTKVPLLSSTVIELSVGFHASESSQDCAQWFSA
jgi:hypothetical protein